MYLHENGASLRASSFCKAFLVLAIVLLAGAAFPHSAAAQTAGSVVTIKDLNSGLCVGTGGSTSFTMLSQSSCSGASAQNFTLQSAPTSGYFYLVNSASQLCWDLAGGSSSAGALLLQYTCVAATPEYFKLSPVSTGVYKVVSYPGLCTGVVGASTTSGAQLEQNTCNGSANQNFVISGNTGSSPPPGAPSISTQPASQTVTAGQAATFSVVISNGPCRSLWSINGTGQYGSVGSTISYTIPNTTLAMNGWPISVNLYGCGPNGVNLGNSQTAILTVKSGSATGAPTVTTQPLSQTVKVGQTATFNVAATGTAPMSYQWQKNSTTISGATSSSYTTPATTSTDNGAKFTAVVSNSAGSVSSGAATLTVNSASATPSVAITSPSNGTTVSGTVTVSGTASDSLGLSSVQVEVDGGGFSTASGTTNWSFSLNTSSLSNATHTITARATDTSGATASASASVTVSNGTGGPTVNVKNYGATGNGSTDDTSAIRSAIAALSSGATLSFPCGTYLTSAQLTLNLSNFTLDGSGCAVIHNTSSGTIVMAIGGSGNGNPNYGSAVSLSATANELATSFSTSSNLGVSAGDYVRLQQGGEDSSAGSGNTGCDAIGCRGELLKVASVSGNTITVTTALHDTYNPSVNAATAQKLLGPITNVTVKNITLDGNGSNVYGLAIAGVMDSSITGVTSRNVQGSALLNRGDFNDSWSNITVTRAGSAQCGSSAWFENQSNIQINGLSISNENPGAPMSGCLYNGAFGFELIGSSNNTLTNVYVDHAGAYGRPVKLGASRWNTISSMTAKNGVQDYNGIVLHYYSSHNVFNDCVVTNNGTSGTGTGNAGINLFGNFNQYNTFNNCTVSGNGNIQFFDSGYDDLRLAADSHNTINGGTFTGSNGVEAVILIEADGDYITGATIIGPGGQGIYLDNQATNACVNNNTFMGNSGLSAAISANSSGDLGLGNLFNLLSSNLSLGVCAPPLP